ncbi:MAG: hypothetical protein PHS57_03395 [Alphaproteobacteria bacterium]|nr:hypothetical protein [Alphaproteobacteria bacterium]
MAHGGVFLGDRASIGERSLLITAGHPIHPSQRHLILTGPIEVKEDALIGADSILVAGGDSQPLSIGRKTIVLPDAIVTRDVPDNCVVGGVNQILLKGEEFFKAAPAGAKALEERLTLRGLERLAASEQVKRDGIKISGNILGSTTKEAADYQTVFSPSIAQDITQRNAFFASSDPDALDRCFLVPPVYFSGTIPTVKERSILNYASSFSSPCHDGIVLSEGTLIAPYAKVFSAEHAQIKLEPDVWVGAKASIVAQEGESITIGRGSILAAGAKITQSVPPMSIVVGSGRVLRSISDNDKLAVPNEWNDRAYCSEQRASAVRTMARKSLKENWVLRR